MAAEFVCTVGEGYVSFAIQEPQPGMWTVEVSTARTQHTPYTVGGFVRSSVGLRVELPTLVVPGDSIDIRASVTNGRTLLAGVRMRTSVSALPATMEDYIRKYVRQLSRIKIPKAFSSDGKPDKIRLQIARLVLLRDQTRQKTGKDILAPVVHDVAMGGAILRPGILHGVGGVLSRIDSGVSLVKPEGAAVLGIGNVIGDITRGSVGNGTMLDPRLVQRPRQTGVLSGRFGRTKIPGSYTVKVVATGVSPSCNSRFVRHDLLSVVVAEKR